MREMRARGMGRQENARVLHLPKEMIEIERRMERQAAKALIRLFSKQRPIQLPFPYINNK